MPSLLFSCCCRCCCALLEIWPVGVRFNVIIPTDLDTHTHRERHKQQTNPAQYVKSDDGNLPFIPKLLLKMLHACIETTNECRATQTRDMLEIQQQRNLVGYVESMQTHHTDTQTHTHRHMQTTENNKITNANVLKDHHQ